MVAGDVQGFIPEPGIAELEVRAIEYTRRYDPLRGQLLPLEEGKKSAHIIVFAHFRPFSVFSSNIPIVINFNHLGTLSEQNSSL